MDMRRSRAPSPRHIIQLIPGVDDSPHILPWEQYDLDHISNGLCLCRHHHWAFDEGLIEVTFEDGIYSMRIPADVVERIRNEAPGFSRTQESMVRAIQEEYFRLNARDQFLGVVHEFEEETLLASALGAPILDLRELLTLNGSIICIFQNAGDQHFGHFVPIGRSV